MTKLPIGATEAERELQLFEDEVAIMAHAERLHMVAGVDYTIEVLSTVVRVITSKPQSPDPERPH